MPLRAVLAKCSFRYFVVCGDVDLRTPFGHLGWPCRRVREAQTGDAWSGVCRFEY